MPNIQSLKPLTLQFVDIGNKINSFISIVSKKYNLPQKELESILDDLWINNTSEASVSSKSSSIAQLNGLKKEELVAKCQSLGLKTSNKSKQQLMDLLTSNKSNGCEMPQKTHVPVRKNTYGNFEHHSNKLVFNGSGVVIGKQVGSEVVSLDKEDITLCKQEKYRYETPNSLDTNVKQEGSKKRSDFDTLDAIIKKVQTASIAANEDVSESGSSDQGDE